MNPSTPTQTAPDTLPADFFSSAPQSSPASAPATTGASASQQTQAAPDTLPADFFNQQSSSSFTTPNGTTLTPGQTVTHSSGLQGQVTGQHPDTGKAVIKWYNKDSHGNPITGDENGQQHTIRANDPQTAGTAVARWAEQVANDVKYGTDFTGIGKVLKKMGAHGVDVGNSEGVGDWMASIPLGILKATKGVGEVGGATTPGQTSAGGAWQGVKDIVGGAGQAAAMPGAVIAPESTELENLAGQAVDHAGELASNAVSKAGDVATAGAKATGRGAKAVAKAPAKLIDKTVDRVLPAIERTGPENVATKENNFEQTIQPVYDELHQNFRDAVANAASKVGVKVKPSESIQDVATDAATALKDKASKWYSQIDDAIEAATGQPGRYQAHDDNLSALYDKLQDAIAEPEAQAKYEKAIQVEEAAKQASLQHIKNAGLEDLPQRATALHKQARALEDLGKKVQASTEGLPGDVGNPERLNPKTFGTSLKNLKNNARYGGSRLEQALGKDNAANLIQHTSDARVGLDQAGLVEKQRVLDAAEAASKTNKEAQSRDTLRKVVKGVGKTAAYSGIVDQLTGGHGGHAVGHAVGSAIEAF